MNSQYQWIHNIKDQQRATDVAMSNSNSVVSRVSFTKLFWKVLRKLGVEPASVLRHFAAYRSLKLTRDASGVLMAEFHTNDGPFTFTAQDHTELADAFIGSLKIDQTR